MKRYYKLESSSINVKNIRFKATTLQSVALKVAEYLFNRSSKKMISFCLKNSTNKSYNYKAKISALGDISLSKKMHGGSVFNNGDIVLLYDTKENKYLSKSHEDYYKLDIDPRMNIQGQRDIYGIKYILVDKNHIDKYALWKIHKSNFDDKYTFTLLYPHPFYSNFKYLSHTQSSTYQYNRKKSTFIFPGETYFISNIDRYFKITDNDEITDEPRFCPYLDKLPNIQVQHAKLEDYIPSISQLRTRETHSNPIQRKKQSIADTLLLHSKTSRK